MPWRNVVLASRLDRLAHYNRGVLAWDQRKLRRFRAALLAWFARGARPLPWRQTRDPYRIWLSEIMLQQTRVAVVVGYYERFLRRFPSVAALARARVSSVLALWSGLGYYRRARSLHAAARQIARAEMPQAADAWRELPGIGRYTANAIASQAFREPRAVVDGNVARVVTRLAGKEMRGEAVWQTASQLLDCDSPGDFNQAMMELGATVCIAQPRCGECPVVAFCATRGATPRVPQPARQKKTVCYALDVAAQRVRLVQRSANDSLMPGMWELPPSRSANTPSFRLRHAITTTDYDVAIVRTRARRGVMTSTVKLARLPLTGIARKALRRAGLLD